MPVGMWFTSSTQPISTRRSPPTASKPVVSVSSTISRIQQSLRFARRRVDRLESKMPPIESAGKCRDAQRIAGGEAARLDRVASEVLHLRMPEQIGDQRRRHPRRLAQEL